MSEMNKSNRNANSAEIANRANENAKRAAKFPAGVQYAIIQVLPNIRNGAFWSFTDMANIEKHINVIKSESNIVARKLGNACLIEVVPQFMLSSVTSIDPTAITKDDLDKIQTKMAEAVVEFEKFLISRGKKAEGFEGTIGIYCMNDVTSIRYKNVSYPAFRLSMGTVLELLNLYGYAIKVGGNWAYAQQASGAGQALWDSTILSPTKTGIFIDIKSTYTPDRMKECEKQFKAKYSMSK